MTIAVLYVDPRGRISLLADSKLSGSAGTDFGAKIFELPLVVTKAGAAGKFKIVYDKSIGLVFAGSFLSAVNTVALASGCLQNLFWRSAFPTFKEVINLLTSISQEVTSDIVTKSSGLGHDPTRYFSDFLVVGRCPRTGDLKKFRIYPIFDGTSFRSEFVELDVGSSQFYPIGSGAEEYHSLLAWMSRRGFERGPYGALELMIALGARSDVGGAIQYGSLEKAGFRLRPVASVRRDDLSHPTSIAFLGKDVLDLPRFETCDIGYSVVGPFPLKPWLGTAISLWNQDHPNDK